MCAAVACSSTRVKGLHFASDCRVHNQTDSTYVAQSGASGLCVGKLQVCVVVRLAHSGCTQWLRQAAAA